MEDHYKQRVMIPSDINEHLPTLREYTLKCNSVVECGVRNIVSSFAFAVGLKGRQNTYTMVDPYKSNQIDLFSQMCHQEG